MIERAQKLEIMENAVNQLRDKLKARVVRVTQETLEDSMETVGFDDNKLLILRVFRCAFSKMLTTMLKDGRVPEASKSAIIRVPACGPLV